MAMTGAGLKAAIKAKLEAAFGSADDVGVSDDFLEAFSEAIVEYIQGNADVNGVTSGGDTVGIN